MDLGSNGFSKEYWKENYDDPLTMDGHGNAKEHVRYIKSLLDLHQIEVNSIVDLGFGLGAFSRQLIKIFHPKRFVGIEPSEYVFNKMDPIKLSKQRDIKISLYQEDIVKWSKMNRPGEKSFDLGVCNSVFQYMSDEEIKIALKNLSKKIRYLYLTVPTDEEFKKQIDELGFCDRFAIHRSQRQYLHFIKAHWVVVGSRFLESRYYFNKNNTAFNDLLYYFD